MNKISKIQLAELDELKENAREAIESLYERLTELKDEAQECFDNRSEKWQESEKAEFYDSWIQEIEAKADEVDGINSELNDIDFSEIEKPE